MCVCVCLSVRCVCVCVFSISLIGHWFHEIVGDFLDSASMSWNWQQSLFIWRRFPWFCVDSFVSASISLIWHRFPWFSVDSKSPTLLTVPMVVVCTTMPINRFDHKYPTPLNLVDGEKISRSGTPLTLILFYLFIFTTDITPLRVIHLASEYTTAPAQGSNSIHANNYGHNSIHAVKVFLTIMPICAN